MHIVISDPMGETIIFGLFLLALLVLTLRRDTDREVMSRMHTTELKGFAILAIILGHIGYFLAADTRFLFPFSVLAGVGVDLFLMLSGFGLTHSAIGSHETFAQYYKRRLASLYVPMWVVLTAFVALDFVVLKIGYPAQTLVRNFLGFFPSADLFKDINSPLWYFSLIVFYYLFFPLVFWKKSPVLSAALLFGVSYLMLLLPLPVTAGVLGLYKLHILAFPLGMALAWVNREHVLVVPKGLWRLPAFVAVASAFGWFAVHSGVGAGVWREQAISLLCVTLLIKGFALASVQSTLLVTIGTYSYEIYLLHWPIMYRYDFLYKYLPASLATLGYLALFVCLGWAVKSLHLGKISARITSDVQHRA